MARSEADLETLRTLLLSDWQTPLCVIGMGDLGASTRISFAKMGSCLTYGYLDRPMAPGQISAAALAEKIKTA